MIIFLKLFIHEQSEFLQKMPILSGITVNGRVITFCHNIARVRWCFWVALPKIHKKAIKKKTFL